MTQPPNNLTPAPDESPALRRSPVARHLRAALITGLLTLLPLFITIYILTVIFSFLTIYTHPIAVALVTPFFPGVDPKEDILVRVVASGLAFIISVVAIYILGVLGNFVIGRRLLDAFDHLVGNLPLIKGIYGTIKQVIAVFRHGGPGQSFQRVVLVEFPRAGTWTVAFVTNTITDTSTNQQYVCCFIPMTPNPTSGFFQMFPGEQVHDTDWTVDQGIKIILSGGLLAPSDLNFGRTTTPKIHPPAQPLTTPPPPTPQ